jgi:hypothetical protein
MSKKPFEQFDPTDTTHPLYDPARDPSHPFYEKDKTDGEQRSDPQESPPDLLDDDGAKAEAVATSAAPPQPDKPAKAAPEPVLDENGKPLPVSDIRYIRAMRERHLAQQKKNQGG